MRERVWPCILRFSICCCFPKSLQSSPWVECFFTGFISLLLQDLETQSYKEQPLHKQRTDFSFQNESLLKVHGICSVISLWPVVLLCCSSVDVGSHPDTSTLVPVQNFQVVPRVLHFILQARKGAGELGRPVSARDRIQPQFYQRSFCGGWLYRSDWAPWAAHGACGTECRRT